MKRIEINFYVDYKSPFAYLAQRAAYELAEIEQVNLRWLPHTLKIEEYLDPVEGRSGHNWRKVRYSYMDARRLANQQGLIVRGPRKLFKGYYANVGLLFAQNQGFFRAYNDMVFERFWKRDLDIDSLGAMSEVIRILGGDVEEYEDFACGEGRLLHDGIMEQATQQGVFGVPTFVLDGELFWGTDRIPMLRERLGQLIAALAGADSPVGEQSIGSAGN